MRQHCRLLNQRKYTRRKWAPAFIRGITIKLFVRSVRDYYSVPLSNGNNEMIISGSELCTSAAARDSTQSMWLRKSPVMENLAALFSNLYSELWLFMKKSYEYV